MLLEDLIAEELCDWIYKKRKIIGTKLYIINLLLLLIIMFYNFIIALYILIQENNAMNYKYNHLKYYIKI